MKARLFVAVVLDAGVRSRIERAVGPLRAVDAKVGWVPDRQRHLTLRFLGEGDHDTDALECRLKDLAGSTAPFRVELSGAGSFPRGRRPRVLWVGVRPARPLLALQRRVERTAADLGYDPERGAFTPHVTVGRVRSADSPTASALLAALPQVRLEVEQRVEAFSLVRSRLGPGGVDHEEVERFTLGGGASAGPVGAN